MKRSELTYKAMENMGWVAINKVFDLEDIVYNIKAIEPDGNYLWKYLKCSRSVNTFSRIEFNMCSTYENYYKIETLEVSTDNKNWYEVAQRRVKVGSKCIYAD